MLHVALAQCTTETSHTAFGITNIPTVSYHAPKVPRVELLEDRRYNTVADPPLGLPGVTEIG